MSDEAFANLTNLLNYEHDGEPSVITLLSGEIVRGTFVEIGAAPERSSISDSLMPVIAMEGGICDTFVDGDPGEMRSIPLDDILSIG